ncbi:hypothetical protein HN289_22585 [Acinetobacter baumannii]|nr:hypothetical protein [Acinetobacter baumannii]
MTGKPEEALEVVEQAAETKGLRHSHLVPSVRGELLSRLGRTADAQRELLTAADLAGNEQVARTLRAKAAELEPR